jgi:hypothetical protein
MALSPEAKKYYKPRIDNLKAGFILAGPAAVWGVQVGLSLTGVGEVGSEILAIGEDIVTPAVLYFAGAYKGNNLGIKMVTTFILEVAEATPFVNDLPFGVMEIITIIVLTRIEDRKEAEKKAAAATKVTQRDRDLQALRVRNAQSAQMRADQVRQQALAESKAMIAAAANDNNFAEEFSEAA